MVDITRGAGGLAGALDPVARRLGDEAVWICAATSEDDHEALARGEEARLRELLGYPVRMLEIDPDVYRHYYDEVSNRMLWFANHCLWHEVDPSFAADNVVSWREAYQPVNQMFANAIAEATGPSSLILLQDYHLALTPRYLRDIRPDQTVLHFTHSSFCGWEGLANLPDPVPRQVIEGMLGADLVGFHVAPWAGAFIECCDRIGARLDRERGLVEHRGSRSWIRTYPIPVDVHDLDERARGAAARAWARRFVDEAEGRRLIVRADRIELSKNIVRGFEAHGLLLDSRPELAATTRFIACLYPSRQSMPEYRRYSEEVEAAAHEVNVRHPGAIQLFMEDDFDRTLGALAVYDVLLVNSIMDGMNLVSKEGPAVNERDGVLVLSRDAGSFVELCSEAVIIDDPLDVAATRDALEIAVTMEPVERAKRARRLKQIVHARRPEDWIEPQLTDLASVRTSGEPVSDAP